MYEMELYVVDVSLTDHHHALMRSCLGVCEHIALLPCLCCCGAS